MSLLNAWRAYFASIPSETGTTRALLIVYLGRPTHLSVADLFKFSLHYSCLRSLFRQPPHLAMVFLVSVPRWSFVSVLIFFSLYSDQLSHLYRPVIGRTIQSFKPASVSSLISQIANLSRPVIGRTIQSFKPASVSSLISQISNLSRPVIGRTIQSFKPASVSSLISQIANLSRPVIGRTIQSFTTYLVRL